MQKVNIELLAEYVSSSILPDSSIIQCKIVNLYTMEAYMKEGNGLFTLYISSSKPFNTRVVLMQKLGDMAAEALITASDANSLCTVIGTIKVMNKLLN
jgi:hypothetical protein